MENQVTNNPYALPLFFTEDVFIVPDKFLADSSQNEGNIVENLKVSLNDKTQADTTEHNYTLNIEAGTTVQEPKPKIEFSFLGGNKKHILILVNDKQNEVSTEAGNALLKNILKSIQLKKDDFALVNIAQQNGGKFSDLNNFFNPTIMLAFGVSSLQLDLRDVAAGERITQDNVDIVFASNLDHLGGEEKKVLWRHLQACTF